MPEIGQPAPDFTLPRDGGGGIPLPALHAKLVLLYIHPKDDTPGRTREAIGFSRAAGGFAAAGAVVPGVSKGTLARREILRDKHDLTAAPLSDARGEGCERYGVWVHIAMYGRKYMGIERAPYLIGGSGRVAQEWRKVKVCGHADTVLGAARAVRAASARVRPTAAP
jgi:thioredoxin-dependent peroxiredoxin